MRLLANAALLHLSIALFFKSPLTWRHVYYQLELAGGEESIRANDAMDGSLMDG